MIENIVFDMGNVLIRFDPLFYAQTYADSEEDQNLLLEEVLRSVEWIQIDRGSISYEQAVASICARMPERLHASVNSLVTGWYKDQGRQPIPGMEELVLELKQNGYGVYLLSNTGRAYHEFSKDIPACRHFDGEFISADWYMLKPSEVIYRTFCNHFSLDPVSCLFIDDMPLNVEGALNTGMRGIIFRGDIGRLKAELRENGIRISSGIESMA